MGKPRNTENTRHTRKYPKYPEIPESKKDTRKYPIVFFDTPTRPEPDPLPGILSNTRPDPILKNPTRWVLNTEYQKFANMQNSTWRERGWCAGRNDRETRILRTVHGATGPGYHDQSEITCTGIISKCVELKVTGDCEGE